jgi:hypothetical protein
VTLIHFGLRGQTLIKGTIKDHRGKPVPGVSISLKNSYDGGTSDSLGNYRFTTAEKDSQTLVISSVGYKPLEVALLIKGAEIVQNASIREEPNEMKAVTITAGSFSAGDKIRGAVLGSLDIATTAGSNADITSALKTLPGTSQVGEQEGLFVRGGTGAETQQYIDGTIVNNPYFTAVPDIAQRGRFSPFLFKGTVFSTGGYSALYGQALSSVVLLESIDLPEKTQYTANISPLVVGVGTQQLAKNQKSSWGSTYNYVNAGPYFNLVPQTPDYFDMPQFHSGDANFRIKTKSGGMIKYYTTFQYNRLGLRRPDIDSPLLKDAYGLTNYNWYNNLSWKEYLANGWRMNLGLGYSLNKNNILQQVQNQANLPEPFPDSTYWMTAKNYRLINSQNLAQAKLVMEKKLSGLSALRFGGEYGYTNNPSTYQDTPRRQIENYIAVFAESDIYLTNALAAKLGLRFEHSSIINQSDLAPRISLAYKTGEHAQVSMAYGIFYQKPEYQYLAYSTNIGFAKAEHFILNYQKMTNDRIFRVEAYYKKYQNLVKTLPVNYYFSYYDNTGSGYAQGIDFFWRDKKTFKNFDYWISYSYLDTKRDYLNYTGQLMPNYAATHTASIVTKRFFTELKAGFNITYSFATGRPYYNFMLNNGSKYFMADQGQTKDYSSLNFSMEYIPSLNKKNAKTFVVLFASVTNVLGYQAIYGYNYSFSGLVKQPVEPPANRFYFIGCFLSWGVDRSEDAINNNL